MHTFVPSQRIDGSILEGKKTSEAIGFPPRLDHVATPLCQNLGRSRGRLTLHRVTSRMNQHVGTKDPAGHITIQQN